MDEYFEEAGRIVLPVMLDVTIVDSSGHTRSGLTIEAFFTSVKQAKQLIAGINCARGASQTQHFYKSSVRNSLLSVSIVPWMLGRRCIS